MHAKYLDGAKEHPHLGRDNPAAPEWGTSTFSLGVDSDKLPEQCLILYREPTSEDIHTPLA